MYVNISMNVKTIMLVSVIGSLGYMLYIKDLKIKSLTRDIEEMKTMKGE